MDSLPRFRYRPVLAVLLLPSLLLIGVFKQRMPAARLSPHTETKHFGRQLTGG
jgi:hypothetical protein